MLSAASVLSKSIIPGALFPIGIVTALIGVPFFIWLILGRGVNVLEISRLSLSLGQQTLLRDLSLTLHPGQVHVIIGPERDRQDLLDAHPLRRADPGQWRHPPGDQSARQMTQARWRQQFGYMPQNIQLELDLSVIEVVVLGRLDSLSMRLADEDILAAGRALQALGIAHLADRPLLPERRPAADGALRPGAAARSPHHDAGRAGQRPGPAPPDAA